MLCANSDSTNNNTAAAIILLCHVYKVCYVTLNMVLRYCKQIKMQNIQNKIIYLKQSVVLEITKHRMHAIH